MTSAQCLTGESRISIGDANERVGSTNAAIWQRHERVAVQSKIIDIDDGVRRRVCGIVSCVCAAWRFLFGLFNSGAAANEKVCRWALRRESIFGDDGHDHHIHSFAGINRADYHRDSRHAGVNVFRWLLDFDRSSSQVWRVVRQSSNTTVQSKQLVASTGHSKRQFLLHYQRHADSSFSTAVVAL